MVLGREKRHKQAKPAEVHVPGPDSVDDPRQISRCSRDRYPVASDVLGKAQLADAEGEQ